VQAMDIREKLPGKKAKKKVNSMLLDEETKRESEKMKDAKIEESRAGNARTDYGKKEGRANSREDDKKRYCSRENGTCSYQDP